MFMYQSHVKENGALYWWQASVYQLTENSVLEDFCRPKKKDTLPIHRDLNLKGIKDTKEKTIEWYSKFKKNV